MTGRPAQVAANDCQKRQSEALYRAGPATLDDDYRGIHRGKSCTSWRARDIRGLTCVGGGPFGAAAGDTGAGAMPAMSTASGLINSERERLLRRQFPERGLRELTERSWSSLHIHRCWQPDRKARSSDAGARRNYPISDR